MSQAANRLRGVALVALCLAAACHPRGAVVRAAQPGVSIVDYGASPDAADNRVAIQHALDVNAGGTVRVPAGRWVVARAGAAYFCLSVPAGTTLVGDSRDGSVLVEAAGIAPSIRLLEVDAPGITVQSLTLDGQRALQTTDEHRAGVFARGARLAVRDVRATGFTGDGLYLYTGADGAVLDHVSCDGNARNGATYGGAITGGVITASTFAGNGAQQFDSEPGSPGHIDGLQISGSTFDGRGVSSDYVLTISGSGAANRSSGWTVSGNTVNGPMLVVWADTIRVADNTGTNPTAKPSLRIYRRASAVTISGNDWTAPAAALGIEVVGTGAGQSADSVMITGNRLNVGGSGGIQANGAISVEVDDNVITNPRGTGAAAIAARATIPDASFAAMTARRNTATGFYQGVAIRGVIGSTAQLGALVAMGNRLGAAWYLDDGSGALQTATLSDNADTVARWPAGAVVVTNTTTTMTRTAP